MDDKLLQLYFEGRTTEEQSRLITEWLDADAANMKHYQQLCRLYEIGFWHEKPETVTLPLKEKFRWWSIMREVVKIAAVFMLGFALNYWLNPDMEENIAMQTIHVPAGQNAQLTLADGSKVWLNAGSTLNFPTRFVEGKRQVTLEGEGFFEVKANKEKPFIVSTSTYDIKALGTSFNVMAYETDESSSVVLVTGAVQVDTKDDEDFRLEPNRMFSYNQGECDIKEVNVNDYILWKDGLYTYRSEHLSVILDRLSRYYGKKISYKSDVADLKCSGKLDMQEDLEVVLDGLSQTAPILYKKIDEEYIVVKEGR